MVILAFCKKHRVWRWIRRNFSQNIFVSILSIYEVCYCAVRLSIDVLLPTSGNFAVGKGLFWGRSHTETTTSFRLSKVVVVKTPSTHPPPEKAIVLGQNLIGPKNLTRQANGHWQKPVISRLHSLVNCLAILRFTSELIEGGWNVDELDWMSSAVVARVRFWQEGIPKKF